jgi:hypothetical protein
VSLSARDWKRWGTMHFHCAVADEESSHPTPSRELRDMHSIMGSGLAIVIFKKALEEIGGGAYSECPRLDHIVIPYAVKRIEDEAFGECNNITTMTLHDGLEEIGMGAFGDNSLHEIVIPNAVKTIRDRVLANCSRLTTETLGSGLEVMAKLPLCSRNSLG